MNPDVQEAAGSVYSYVVEGAILKCSCGDGTSYLSLPVHHRIYIKNIPQANVKDYSVPLNFESFGLCQCMANPAVQASQAKKAPCITVTQSPWINGKDDVLLDEAPALLNKSTLMCMYGGIISIEDDGQV